MCCGRSCSTPATAASATPSAVPSSTLSGTRWILLGEAPQAADRLVSHGADVAVRARDHVLTEADGPVDGVLYLGALDDADDGPVLPDAFPVLKAALARGPHWLLAVRAMRRRDTRPPHRRAARSVPDGGT